MQDIPKDLMNGFLERLRRSNIPVSYYVEYLQWLRYYLDFSAKNPFPNSKAERVRIFCEKLKNRNRTADQQRRTAHAVSLYFAMVKNGLPATAQMAPSGNTVTACMEQSSILDVVPTDVVVVKTSPGLSS